MTIQMQPSEFDLSAVSVSSSPVNTVRFAIIHADTLTATAVAAMLERYGGFACAAVAATAAQADLAALRTDMVIIIDKEKEPQRLLPEVSAVCAASPNSLVCVVTDRGDIDLVQAALRLGARGYFLKDVSAARFVSALRTMHETGGYLDERLSRAIFAGGGRRRGRSAELSERERDICRFVARGLSNRAVAEALHLSGNTVKNHVSNVLSKLHLTSRTQIAMYAYEKGL